MSQSVAEKSGEAAADGASDRTPAPRLEIVGRRSAEAPASAPAAETAAAPKRKGGGVRKLLLSGVLLAAIAGGSWYGHQWWVDGRFMVTTDDAYIGADMAIMTPKITGYIASVPVTENSRVKAGDPIVEIDAGDYQLALRSAEAKLATQRATVDSVRAQRAAAVEQVNEAGASRTALQATTDQAALDLDRAERLVRSGAGTQATLDTARSAKAEADARLGGAQATISAANAQVGVLDAQIQEGETKTQELVVARDQAARDLSFTTLRAPYDGIVGNLAAQPGDLVSPSRRLAAIVPLDKVYVDANFKETQLGEIVAGERARIEVDALPGVEVTGTVESVAPASGSVFSLLPADNATGNFTKIVQRVPVRIAIDADDAHSGKLRPGLSVTVSVDRRTAPGAEQAAGAN